MVGFEQPSPSSVCLSLESVHPVVNMAGRAAVHSTLGKALTEQPRPAPLLLRVKTRPVPLGRRTVSMAPGPGGLGSPVDALMDLPERTPSSAEREQLSRASSGSIDIPIPTRCACQRPLVQGQGSAAVVESGGMARIIVCNPRSVHTSPEPGRGKVVGGPDR